MLTLNDSEEKKLFDDIREIDKKATLVIEKLRARIAELERVLVHSSLALDDILHELGVPGEGYPAPVSNAVDFAKEAIAEIKSVLGKGE